MTVNVPAKIHADLGASKASRWMACPGSVRMSKDMPNYETEYSKIGTGAHAVLELALRKGMDADMWEGVTVEDVEITADITAAVQTAVDYCRGIMQRPGVIFGIEDHISLDSLNPPGPMHGTSDFWAYDPALAELEVVDYKNGSGVVVEVVDNWQLIYYALGVALKHSKGRDIHTVKITVIQPNANHADGIIRSWVVDYVELFGKAEELMQAARRTLDPQAALVAGKHCRFCPASAVCPAQRDQVQALAQIAFTAMPAAQPPAPESLPPAILGEILQHLPTLEEWAKACRVYAQRKAEEGDPIPGTKIVAKRATRGWTNDSQVVSFLRDDKGLSDEEIFQQKLKSPAQIEKIPGIGKKGLPTEFVRKESSGNKLVLDSDPRPAVAVAAADVFTALPPGPDATTEQHTLI